MKTLQRRLVVARCLSVMAVAGALVMSGCGSDDSSSSTTPSDKGNGTDLAFVNDMIPHHKSAVVMAKIAQQRSQRAEIKGLADDIVASQTTEISQMQKIAAVLKADGVQPGSLGVAEHEMGMSGDEASLETAEPFDREFIDMMIPHHQGAIRMARIELSKGSSAEAKKLAQAIVDAQTREIGDMNDWRKRLYGAVSPAGGVPVAAEKPAAEKPAEGMPANHGM